MNYFNYQPEGTLGRVWSLFAGLDRISEEEKLCKSRRSCAYSHTLEIVNAAMNGSLSTEDADVEEFNLEAYEFRCRENDTKNKIKQTEKLLYIVDSTGEDDESVGFGDISERKLKSVEESFEILESLTSFESNLLKLYNIRSEYIRDRGVDVVGVLSSSLKGIPDAVSQIKELIGENSRLRDLVVSLCEDGSEGLLMSRLETAL